MKKEDKRSKEIIDLLFKKANGFHYVEEQYEYEKSKDDGVKSPKVEKISFFDNLDRGETNYSSESDKLKVNNETIKIDERGLSLTKKKITTHYIPPDMVAIKILLEIYSKEGVNDLSQISDEELLKMKDKIIEELNL